MNTEKNRNKTPLSRDDIALYAMEIMNEHGDIYFSLSDIRNRFGVSAGTLYRNFKSKHELLAFIYLKTLSAFFEYTQDSSRYNLNAKERIIGFACMQTYTRSIYPDSVGIDMMCTNKFVFEQSSSHLKGELSRLISEIQSHRIQQFTHAIKTGELVAAEQEITKALKHLSLISRGSLLLSNHIFLNSNKCKIHDLIDFCEIALNQFQWIGESESIDRNKMLISLRTMIDRRPSAFIR